MKSVSVSAELTTIQRAIEGATLLVEVDRQGGVEGEDSRPLVAAILALASCRLRDLGQSCPGILDVENFWTRHNTAVEDSDQEDLILYPTAPAGRPKR